MSAVSMSLKTCESLRLGWPTTDGETPSLVLSYRVPQYKHGYPRSQDQFSVSILKPSAASPTMFGAVLSLPNLRGAEL